MMSMTLRVGVRHPANPLILRIKVQTMGGQEGWMATRELLVEGAGGRYSVVSSWQSSLSHSL